MIHLIDASVYIFRAYFALPEMRDAGGKPAQAVYGFLRFLIEFLERTKPRHVACAFDESLNSSFRNRLYPPYKANRELPPVELERQLKACRRAAEALGIATFSSRRYEADDLIGTLARRHRTKRRPVVVVTRDKDLAQLIGPGDVFWDFAANERLDEHALASKLGVLPRQVPDLLGLAGDAVDNIPGVRGIGVRTAAALLARYNDLGRLYANLDRIADLELRGAKRIAALLAADRDMAFLSRQLATVRCDVPLNTVLADLQWRRPQPRAVNRLFRELGFGAGLRQRIEVLANVNYA